MRARKRNGSAGKGLAKVIVTAGAVSQRTKKRGPKGAYALEVDAGTQTVSASAGQKLCRIGSLEGPQALDVTVAADTVVTVGVFCGKP